MAFSWLNHFPRSTSRQRFEQKGLKGVENQSPIFLQDGHWILAGEFMPEIFSKNGLGKSGRQVRLPRANDVWGA